MKGPVFSVLRSPPNLPASTSSLSTRPHDQAVTSSVCPILRCCAPLAASMRDGRAFCLLPLRPHYKFRKKEIYRSLLLWESMAQKDISGRGGSGGADVIESCPSSDLVLYASQFALKSSREFQVPSSINKPPVSTDPLGASGRARLRLGARVRIRRSTKLSQRPR
jgi:hypothetical protein